jgi:5-enolpyruvylshikimate-3-phosphate synthase
LKYIPKKEGVILQAAAENKRIETKEDFNRAAFSFFILSEINDSGLKKPYSVKKLFPHYFELFEHLKRY